MVLCWPNTNTKWLTLDELLLHLAQHYLIFQLKLIKILYDWPIIADYAAAEM